MTTRMRRLYRTSVMAAERSGGPEPPAPFDDRNPDAFLNWLNQPAADGPDELSRYLYSIYQDRLDLQIQFPDIKGSDAARFAEWIWRDSDLKEKIPVDLLPVAGGGLHVIPGRARPTGERAGPAPDAAPGADASGIGPLEFMLPHLEKMATLQESAEGRWPDSAAWPACPLPVAEALRSSGTSQMQLREAPVPQTILRCGGNSRFTVVRHVRADSGAVGGEEGNGVSNRIGGGPQSVALAASAVARGRARPAVRALQACGRAGCRPCSRSTR
jgi:hypothetical protein